MIFDFDSVFLFFCSLRTSAVILLLLIHYNFSMTIKDVVDGLMIRKSGFHIHELDRTKYCEIEIDAKVRKMLPVGNNGG